MITLQISGKLLLLTQEIGRQLQIQFPLPTLIRIFASECHASSKFSEHRPPPTVTEKGQGYKKITIYVTVGIIGD